MFPQVISPHCTGDAVIRDKTGRGIGGYSASEVRSNGFAGRAIRCIDQTLKNIFYGTYNIVGTYITPDSKPINDQVIGIGCLGASGNVAVAKASDCNNGLFVRFQNYSKNIVSVVLTFAIVLIGLLLLFGVFDNAKIGLKYLVTYSIVLYFVYGNAWRDGYYDFLMEAGTELGGLIFNSLEFGGLDTTDSNLALQTVNLPDSLTCIASDDGVYGPNGVVYASSFNEKKYLVWDMYDCRTANFFGAGKVGSWFVSFLSFNIIALLAFVVIAIVIGPITLLIFVFVLLKSLFMITSTMIVVMLLVFLSPLVIPLVLFSNQKARGIFDNWLRNLIGYSLVPLILFSVLGIFFNVLDHAMYGSKVNDVYTVNSSGTTVISDECKEIYIPCIMHKMKTGTYKDTKYIIGIPIPWVTTEFNTVFIQATLRLLFIFLVMLLVFNFITKSLISGLLGVSVMEDNVVETMKKAGKAALAVATKGASKAFSGAKKLANKVKGRNNNDYGTKGATDGKDK